MVAVAPLAEIEATRARLRPILRRLAEYLVTSYRPPIQVSLSPASPTAVILSLLDKAEALNEDSVMVRLLLRFASTLERSIPINQLDGYLDAALSMSSLSPEQFVELASVRIRLLTQSGDRDTAQAVLEHSWRVADASAHLHAELYIRQGLLAVSFGDFTAGAQAYQRGWELAKAHNDKARMSIIYNNLGNRAYALDQYYEALAYYEQALAVAQELPDPVHRTRAEGGMAMTLDELGRYGEAEYYYHIARKSAEQSNDLFSLLSIELNLSYHAILQRHFADAIAPAGRALMLARELGDWDREAFALHNLGQACLGKGDYEAAVVHLIHALERRVGIGKPLFIQTTRDAIEQLCEAIDTELSLDPLIQAHLLQQCQRALEAAGQVQPPVQC